MMNSKRQRRPSVRLGEVGDVPAASACWFPQETRELLTQMSWEDDLIPTPELGDAVFAGTDHGISPLASTDTLQNIENTNPNSSKSHLGSDFGAVTWKIRKPRCRIPRGYTLSPEVGSGDGAAFSERQYSGGFGSTDRCGRDCYPHKESDSIGCGVRRWLQERGFGEYAEVFEMHEVDEEALPILTFGDLKEMGVFVVGHRRKLYTVLQQIRCSF